MNYVEWLRVRNCVRIFAICLCVLIVIAGIVRLSLAAQFGNDQALIDHIQREPGMTVSHSVVNGMARTTIVSPRDHTTVTIDDRPDGGRLIRITEPAKSGSKEIDSHTFGSVNIYASAAKGTRATVINTNAAVPFAVFLVIAEIIGLIMATVLGASFARETEGHLEIALLKPVTRERYSLGIIGADVVGILAAEAMAIIAAIICQAMFEVPHFSFEYVGAVLVGLTVVVPLAWYAMLNAATASMRRGAGTIVGFSWPIAFIVLTLADLPLVGTAVGQVFHTIFWTASRLIPITYASFHFGNRGELSDPNNFTLRLAVVCGLLLVYGALAVVQWRRVEA